MQMAIKKVKLSDSVEIHFRSVMDYSMADMEIGMGRKVPVKLFRFLYERRVDEAQIVVMPPCLSFPLEFHGCLTAAAAIIKVANSENLVYEGEADVVLNPRQIIQQTARSYGVDPSEMMGRYADVRPYLANTALEVPNSIEDTLNLLQSRGGTDIKGRM